MAPPYMRMTPQFTSLSTSDHLTAFKTNKATVEAKAIPAIPIVLLKKIQARSVGIMTSNTFFSFLEMLPNSLTFASISFLQDLICIYFGVILIKTSDASKLMRSTIGIVNRIYFEKEMV